MDVANYLINNPQLLKAFQYKREFFCDFETLTDKNAIVNKYGNKISDVYLWGIRTPKIDITLWGTEIKDFWQTLILLATNLHLKRGKIFYFVNLSWDYEFLKNYLNEKYIYTTMPYNKWLKEKSKYLKENDMTLDNHYHIINNRNDTIMLTLLTNGNVIQIKCMYRLTSMSVKKMEKSLIANNINTPSKNKELIDYDLVKKVYGRKTFYKMVYGTTKNYENNFFETKINKKSKYGYHLKYLENDCLIPTLYFKLFGNTLNKINSSLMGLNLPYIDKGVWFGIGKQTKFDDTNKNVIAIRKVKIINIKNNTNYTFNHTDFQKVYISTIKEIQNKEIWVLPSTYSFINYYKEIIDWQDLKQVKYHKILKVKKYLDTRSMTFSGLSFAGFKRWYGSKNFKTDYGNYTDNLLTLKQYHIINNAYQGGLTNFNIKHRYSKASVKSIDINSSYPHQLSKDLPYGKALSTRPKKGTSIGFVKVLINKFRIKNKSHTPPYFPRWKTNTSDKNLPRYLYEYNGNSFVASFLIDEWKYFLTDYDIDYDKKSLEHIYFKTKLLTKKFVDKLKKIKLDAKTEGERSLGKYLLNGLYGKCSQRVLLEQRHLVDIEKIDKDDFQWYLSLLANTPAYINNQGDIEYQLSLLKRIELIEILDNPKMVHKKDYAHLVYLNEKRTKFYFTYNKIIENEWLRFRHIGAVITWRARKQLLDTIKLIGWNNVRYFDTDSIYYNSKIDVSKLVNLDDTKFGAWSYEYDIKSMNILGAKKYQLFINKKYDSNNKWKKINAYKYVIAGLKDADTIFEKIGHHLFKKGTILNNVSYKQKRLDSGKILVLRDYELIENGN